MIELTPLARPYAKALFASTLELDATEETGNDLKLMSKISSSPEVKRLIENPTISKKELNKFFIVKVRSWLKAPRLYFVQLNLLNGFLFCIGVTKKGIETFVKGFIFIRHILFF